MLWNNVWLRWAIFLFLGWFVAGSLPAQKLLLTPQRLRRLQRDRDRKTARWVNFENRVESVADSPERGFELALYYAVTRDAKQGREAVQWAVAHPCERRQAALVLDWAGELASADEKHTLTSASCPAEQAKSASAVRDAVFLAIASGQDPEPLIDGSQAALLDWLQNGGFQNAPQLYALCEYLMAARSSEHVDLREKAVSFFVNLPAELLLSMKPARVAHPELMMHLAALALVALDPNLPGSQFLQGWAMEGQQTVQDGSGVAYEFLWADPYLPGIGYQDLDPWTYDPNGRLFARANWNTDTCWISISAAGVEEENCAPGWRKRTNVFGTLTLLPATGACVDVPPLNMKEAALVWQLQPHETMVYSEAKQTQRVHADAAGMLRTPHVGEAKICRSR